MKKFIEVFIVAVISTAIFTLSKYLNVYGYFEISLIGIIVLYLFSGLVLGLYYSAKPTLITFCIIPIFLYLTIFVQPGVNVSVEVLNLAFTIIGFVFGYQFYQFSLIKKLYLSGVLIALTAFTIGKVYPKIIVTQIAKSNLNIVGKPFLSFTENAKIQDIGNRNVDLNEYSKNNVTLIEFYFENCPPCKMKAPVLKKIQNEFKAEDLKIIFINDGRIDEYAKFQSRAKDYLYSFYDSDGTLALNVGVTGYPFELIIDRNGIVRSLSEGYGNSIDNEYYQKTIEKINSLLNE